MNEPDRRHGFAAARRLAHRAIRIREKRMGPSRLGSFTRTIGLPASADQDAVTAAYHAGILTISVGLKTDHKAPAKKIEIAVGK